MEQPTRTVGGWREEMVQKLVKTILATGAMIAATTTHASAEICIWFICFGKKGKGGGGGGQGGGHGGGGSHGGGGGGGGHSAPEIDVSQGAAALLVMAVVALVLREIYLRRKAA
jgi:hypothetical protein